MCDNKYTHTFVVYLFVCLICKQTLVPVYTRVGIGVELAKVGGASPPYCS